MVVGIQNGAAALQDSWGGVVKLNIFSPYSPASELLGIFPKGAQNLCPHKSPHTGVSSLTYSCHDLGATRIAEECPSAGERILHGSPVTQWSITQR